jgi:hypothetical protein
MNTRTRRQRRQTRKWRRPGRALLLTRSVAAFSHSNWKHTSLNYDETHADRLRWVSVSDMNQ